MCACVNKTGTSPLVYSTVDKPWASQNHDVIPKGIQMKLTLPVDMFDNNNIIHKHLRVLAPNNTDWSVAHIYCKLICLGNLVVARQL